MDQSFWAGVATVETASQLAIGGVLIASSVTVVPFRMRQRSGLVHGMACTAAAVTTATLCALVLRASSTHGIASLFAASMVTFVVTMCRTPLVAIPGMSSSLVRRFSLGLVGLAAVVFAFVSPVIGAGAPGVLAGRFEFTAEGRALLAALAAMLVSVLVLLRRAEALESFERRGYFVALTGVVGALLLDCLGLSSWFTPVPLTIHVGLLWCMTLFGLTLAGQYRNSTRLQSVLAELDSSKRAFIAGQTQIEQMQRELGTKKQLAAVGELAAAIAHEVRNPLAIIVNAAAGLRRPTLQVDDRNTLLGILDEETARLNRLVTDLLRFARPVIIKRSTVSIPELAKRVEGRLDDRQILALEIPEDPSLRVVQADANLLRLVFDNLVSNAFQAMPEGGVVRIAVGKDDTPEGAFVRIDIIDRGQGMDEQVKARAIDPFYTTRPSGTGLGLPIVQRIVEAHGGRIAIESALSQGTTVSLFLPNTFPAETEEREREEITLR